MTPLGRGLALAALGAVLAAAFAVHEAGDAVARRAGAMALRAHRDELEAKFRMAQRDLREEQRRRLTLEQPAGQARDPSPSPSPVAAAGADLAPAERRASWFAAHPEARSRYLQAFRAGLATTWGLLFQELNLSPDQVEKLEDLLAQREDNDITVKATASARGLAESAPEIQALDDQLDATNKAALKDLLGKANYATVRNYMHAEEVIPIVDQLAGDAYHTSSPLTADQAMALTQALVDSSQKMDSGRVIANTVDWGQVLERAQAILAPAQFATFAAIQQQEQSHLQMEAVLHSLRPPAAANPAP